MDRENQDVIDIFSNTENRSTQLNEKRRNPWLAGILTWFQFGLGHLYCGQAKKAFIFYFLTRISEITRSFSLLYLNFAITASVYIVTLCFYIYIIINSVKRAKNKNSTYRLKVYNKWYIYLLFFVISICIIDLGCDEIIKKYLFRISVATSESSSPTLHSGDWVIVKTGLLMTPEIKRGKLIVFRSPKDPSMNLIKRVIAIGGDTIEIDGEKVFINGRHIEEPYANYTKGYGWIRQEKYGPVEIPEDSVFVMGDNRNYSADSRIFGPVKKSDVNGTPYKIHWSRKPKTWKVRWDRIGKLIE